MNGRLDDSLANDDHMISGECAFTEEHAAGFALGALDRFERGLVEQHLRWCARCRDTVQDAENVAALLPLLAPPVAPPSDSVRAELMHRIATEADGPLVEVPPVSPRATVGSSPAVPAARDTMPPPAPRGWARMVPAALTAPLAIALIVVAAWANGLQNTIDEQDAELANQQPANGAASVALLNGAEIQMYSMEPSCAGCPGSGQLGVDMADSTGMLVAWNLDPAKKHSVWCVDGKGEKEWISTLDVNADGAAMQTFDFPGIASKYTEVYISRDNDSIAYMTNIATPPAGEAADQQVAPSTPASEPES